MSHVFPIATRTGKSNDFKGYHINSFYETDMFLLLVCWVNNADFSISLVRYH